jgi:ERF superfamily
MTDVMEAPAGGPTPKLNAALARVQADLPRITKDAHADIKGEKNGRPFVIKYDYADLTAISDLILPLLGKNGLAFSTRPTLVDGKFVLVYNLLHESGEQLDGIFPLASSGKPQELGGLITYYRRYALCAVTGVAPGGEDNDAATANHVQQYDSPRSASEAFENAAPAPARQPEVPDVDDGLDDDWLDGIDSQEAADRADLALRDAFKAGTVGPTKAARLREAIQARARELAEEMRPRTGRPDVQEADIATLAAAATAAGDLPGLRKAWDSANAAKKLTASFMHEGSAITLQSYFAMRRKDLEERELVGASA